MEGINYNLLYKHLTDLTGVPLSLQEQLLIQQSVQFRRVKKKQYFWSEGDFCKHLVYISKGAVRIYATDEKGREHTICLAVENEWISDYESFHGFTPSQYFMVAMEDCEIFQVSYQNLSHLKNNVSAVRKMIYTNDYHHIIATQKRIYATVYLTAEERFQQMVDHQPHFINRFSQNTLASYLGITFETLSRIRNQNCININGNIV